MPIDNNDEQDVARVDYQLSANHTLFGRYIDTRRAVRCERSGAPHNVLREPRLRSTQARRAQTLAIGDTQVFGSNTVNTFRVTYNRTRSAPTSRRTVLRCPHSASNVYTYVPATWPDRDQRLHLLGHQRRRRPSSNNVVQVSRRLSRRAGGTSSRSAANIAVLDVH